jgi:hypothetical protein
MTSRQYEIEFDAWAFDNLTWEPWVSRQASRPEAKPKDPARRKCQCSKCDCSRDADVIDGRGVPMCARCCNNKC